MPYISSSSICCCCNSSRRGLARQVRSSSPTSCAALQTFVLRHEAIAKRCARLLHTVTHVEHSNMVLHEAERAHAGHSLVPEVLLG
jgi:hypothetical protein